MPANYPGARSLQVTERFQNAADFAWDPKDFAVHLSEGLKRLQPGEYPGAATADQLLQATWDALKLHNDKRMSTAIEVLKGFLAARVQNRMQNPMVADILIKRHVNTFIGKLRSKAGSAARAAETHRMESDMVAKALTWGRAQHGAAAEPGPSIPLGEEEPAAEEEGPEDAELLRHEGEALLAEILMDAAAAAGLDLDESVDLGSAQPGHTPASHARLASAPVSRRSTAEDAPQGGSPKQQQQQPGRRTAFSRQVQHLVAPERWQHRHASARQAKPRAAPQRHQGLVLAGATHPGEAAHCTGQYWVTGHMEMPSMVITAVSNAARPSQQQPKHATTHAEHTRQQQLQQQEQQQLGKTASAAAQLQQPPGKYQQQQQQHPTPGTAVLGSEASPPYASASPSAAAASAQLQAEAWVSYEPRQQPGANRPQQSSTPPHPAMHGQQVVRGGAGGSGQSPRHGPAGVRREQNLMAWGTAAGGPAAGPVEVYGASTATMPSKSSSLDQDQDAWHSGHVGILDAPEPGAESGTFSGQSGMAYALAGADCVVSGGSSCDAGPVEEALASSQQPRAAVFPDDHADASSGSTTTAPAQRSPPAGTTRLARALTFSAGTALPARPWTAAGGMSLRPPRLALGSHLVCVDGEFEMMSASWQPGGSTPVYQQQQGGQWNHAMDSWEEGPGQGRQGEGTGAALDSGRGHHQHPGPSLLQHATLGEHGSQGHGDQLDYNYCSAALMPMLEPGGGAEQGAQQATSEGAAAARFFMPRGGQARASSRRPLTAGAATQGSEALTLGPKANLNATASSSRSVLLLPSSAMWQQQQPSPGTPPITPRTAGGAGTVTSRAKQSGRRLASSARSVHFGRNVTFGGHQQGDGPEGVDGAHATAALLELPVPAAQQKRASTQELLKQKLSLPLGSRFSGGSQQSSQMALLQRGAQQRQRSLSRTRSSSSFASRQQPHVELPAPPELIQPGDALAAFVAAGRGRGDVTSSRDSK